MSNNKDLTKQKRIRTGHRSYIKKLFATSDELMSADVPDVNKIECMKISLTDRMSTIQGLDDAILLLVEEESIVKEIEEAGKFKEMIQMYLVNINSLLKKLQLTTSQAPVNNDHSLGNTGDSSFTEVTQITT
ncbi:Hypothetical predicted protein [Paramuricea clavata]|uniref:Uncharacterized protein n=1 Tax=Paramuricea clavata TaxID=317549 RepID=A0A6S7FQD8_PARCT|nr:Hypothetical predicted protein [Paramuricea clavata]